jgi:hypothetical protein
MRSVEEFYFLKFFGRVVWSGWFSFYFLFLRNSFFLFPPTVKMDAAATSFSLRLKKQIARVQTRTFFVRRPHDPELAQLLDMLYDKTSSSGNDECFYRVQGCSRGDVIRAQNAAQAVDTIKDDVLPKLKDLLAEQIKNECIAAQDAVHFEARVKQLATDEALRLVAFPTGSAECSATARSLSFLPLFVVPLVAFAYSAGCAYSTDAQRKELLTSLGDALDVGDVLLSKGSTVQHSLLRYIFLTPPMWCNMSRAEEEATTRLCDDDDGDGGAAANAGLLTGKVYQFLNVKEANAASIISGFFANDKATTVTVCCSTVTTQSRRFYADFDRRFKTTTRFVVCGGDGDNDTKKTGVRTRAGAAAKRVAAVAALSEAAVSSSSSTPVEDSAKRQKTAATDAETSSSSSSDVEICRAFAE